MFVFSITMIELWVKYTHYILWVSGENKRLIMFWHLGEEGVYRHTVKTPVLICTVSDFKLFLGLDLNPFFSSILPAQTNMEYQMSLQCVGWT